MLATATQATAAIYFRCKRRQVLEKDEDQVEMDREDTLGKGYIRRGKGIGKRGIFFPLELCFLENLVVKLNAYSFLEHKPNL